MDSLFRYPDNHSVSNLEHTGDLEMKVACWILENFRR